MQTSLTSFLGRRRFLTHQLMHIAKSKSGSATKKRTAEEAGITDSSVVTKKLKTVSTNPPEN
jgi:hypothetical protein